ncbi:VG15 protein [Microbispora sp. ATCC PTA-5024]|uniref:VG15 protein n=1 Tax=Microbispora sp. ATCC PTA-5024 TaxID=316330 RepID=UPI0003DD9272|nr:hypothetical protein [Microbispora sp. ATCC PTA-5024]ETK36135.1 hypothetical protein MPTA5024_10950 [Microbispora sp. ATCC PTA-5024]
MPVQELAAEHYRRQQAIVRDTAQQGQELWRQVKPKAIVPSWLALLNDLLRLLIGGQVKAATLAQPYVDLLAAQQGGRRSRLRLVPRLFSGVASDGRQLQSLLVQPALRSLAALGAGADEQAAMVTGLSSLTRIIETQVADAGRSAVSVATTANRSFTTYVRHVSLPACSRCIILAGREYSWSTGFLRHPNCDCTMVPRVGGEGPEPRSPAELFESMPSREQDRVFGKAGAESIRLGADLGQVVNARRGMTTTLEGRKVTTEGTTRRGVAGKRMGSTGRRKSPVRLMPEQILEDAAGDREEAIRLLKRFGYII